MTSKLQIVTFTLEEDMKLANVVCKHPCLFDLQHVHYKNLNVKENVWNQISVHLKRSGKYFII